jgi:putative Mn2+ efflux pump MntP
MPLTVVLGLALGLALDAFAVAVVVGSVLDRITVRHYFRLGFHFGLFQALMPIVGWLAGRTVWSYAAAWDHWIAFGLLLFVGGRMLWPSSREDAPSDRGDPTRGLSLVVLSVATSLDALAVGLTLALLNVRIILPVVVIGLVAGGLTLAGLAVGRRAGRALGCWAERVGGVVLIGIGVKILVEHLSQG